MIESDSEDEFTKSSGNKSSTTESGEDDRILLVLKAFKTLQDELNTKFRAMWAYPVEICYFY